MGLTTTSAASSKRDHRHKVPAGRPIDRCARELASAVELPRRRHAQGRVEGHHRGAGRAGLRIGAEERARKRQRQQQHGRHAQREQQQFAQVPAVRMLHRRAAQEPDSGKPHARLRLPLEQMQHDRDGGRQGSDEEERRQQSHQRALARVDRYARSAISSGSAVVTSW